MEYKKCKNCFSSTLIIEGRCSCCGFVLNNDESVHFLKGQNMALQVELHDAEIELETLREIYQIAKEFENDTRLHESYSGNKNGCPLCRLKRAIEKYEDYPKL
jgi:hypothetical protein